MKILAAIVGHFNRLKRHSII